jgi:hypothetical protein
MLKNANLVLRFLLELSALAALAYWGYTTGSVALRWLLAIGAPVTLAVVWGLFVSPKAKIDMPRIAQLAIEFALLGAAALALAASGQPVLAVVFAALVLVSGTMNYLWK